MAAPSASATSISSISTHKSFLPTFFNFTPNSIITTTTSFSLNPKTPKPLTSSSSSLSHKLKSTNTETIYLNNEDPEEGDPNFTYEPLVAPDGFVAPPSFDDGPPEGEDDIAAAYEEMYGPAYSGVSVLGNNVYVMDAKKKKATGFGSKAKVEKIRDGFEERVVQVRRVTKVVKGGKQLHFRAVVVVGDKQGNVGVGVGKAKEVISAVQKSATNARRNIISVPLTKYSTFPHRADGDYGAAKVMLRPASPGTGVIAGGSVRIVLEMAGVENALGKQLGSNNALNNARATVAAVQQMRQFSDVARDRGIPMEELWK
ncbi:hypothetical protein GIB67_037870 [Kingdonia uniflora]|uniref:Small ribosomal subunit protein uS5c n=1 Tax=Kingdonia uniflora TaxID=39325 RepID=A0A7J7LH46_9MAGN|nr:hypothetical protein GIB67_037870 [Kingdonia uniflora]